MGAAGSVTGGGSRGGGERGGSCFGAPLHPKQRSTVAAKTWLARGEPNRLSCTDDLTGPTLAYGRAATKLPLRHSLARGARGSGSSAEAKRLGLVPVGRKRPRGVTLFQECRDALARIGLHRRPAEQRIFTVAHFADATRESLPEQPLADRDGNRR